MTNGVDRGAYSSVNETGRVTVTEGIGSKSIMAQQASADSRGEGDTGPIPDAGLQKKKFSMPDRALNRLAGFIALFRVPIGVRFGSISTPILSPT
jgi:hypothetical protein